MNDSYNWFRFFPKNWMMGKIVRQPDEIQGQFMRVCCKYWNDEGVLDAEDVIDEIGEVGYKHLIDKRIIKADNGVISISFLDEEIIRCQDISERASTAGKASAKKRNERQQVSTDVERTSTGVKRPSTDKNRLEEKREDKTREEREITPAQLISSIQGMINYESGVARCNQNSGNLEIEEENWGCYIILKQMDKLDREQLAVSYLKWMNGAKPVKQKKKDDLIERLNKPFEK